MMKHFCIMVVAAFLSLASVEIGFADQNVKTCPANGKLKIFILAGQSNMVGFGQLEGDVGTMEYWPIPKNIRNSRGPWPRLKPAIFSGR